MNGEESQKGLAIIFIGSSNTLMIGKIYPFLTQKKDPFQPRLNAWA